MEFDLLIELLRSDGSIIINKRLAKSLGIDAAIMYSELASKYKYFKNKDELTEDGFFFNTVDNMEEDTTLSKYQQNKALKILCEIRLIKQVNRGLPQKRYFKIINDLKLLNKCLKGVDVTKISKKSKNSPNRSKKTKQIKGEKLASNNTNLNNTEINNTNIKGILTKVENSYDYLGVLNYFLGAYKNYIGEEHPVLKQKQWKDVIEVLFSVDDDFDLIDISEEDEMDMIDKYFLIDFKVQHNILHYISGDIRKLRYFECGLR